jgi:TolB-like protein/DNA-binding winged helix-turn-helix (wHTH) protein/tetratricopeptide (TPR) repeat protein
VDKVLQKKEIYEFGPYRLDSGAGVILRDGELVRLTPKVLDTLLVLVENAGKVVTKDDLLRSVWPDAFVEESNLAQNVSVLRRALGSTADGSPYIETIPKRGYRFVSEVRRGPVVASTEGREPTSPSPASPPQITRAQGSVRDRRKALVLTLIVLALCGSLGLPLYVRHRASVRAIHSLAVLPLKNLSGDPHQDYFADGITELLTQELSKSLPVRVTSRTSAMHYKNKDESLPVIARELNVDAVVEGSVIRSGNRLRVTAKLINAPSDQHLWAETFDQNLVDVMTLQIEIARAIAHEIGTANLAGAQQRAGTVNPDAFEANLRARYYLDQRTTQEIEKAISWFQKAIEADPAYAPAYAGLADCYSQLGTVMVGARSPTESRKLAIAAAKRALEIAPTLAEAHAALGYDNLYDWNWAEAEQEFERAIALNPNYAPAHLWFAHYLTARGEFDRGQQEVQLAADLDPLSPIIQTQIAWLLGHARRYPEAIAQYRKVLAQSPTYQWALWQLGSTLSETGDQTGAIQLLEKATQVGRTPAMVGTLGMVYARAGRRQEAEKLLQELLALSRQSYIPPHALVHIYLGLGDHDKVFEWLEKSYQERSNSLLWLGVGGLFDPVRADPRFEMYLRKIGLK